MCLHGHSITVNATTVTETNWAHHLCDELTPDSSHAILKQRPSDDQRGGARENNVQIPSAMMSGSPRNRSNDCALLQTARPEKPRKAGRESTSGSELTFTKKTLEIRPKAVEELVSTVELEYCAKRVASSVQISRCERLGHSHQVITGILPKSNRGLTPETGAKRLPNQNPSVNSTRQLKETRPVTVFHAATAGATGSASS